MRRLLVDLLILGAGALWLLANLVDRKHAHEMLGLAIDDMLAEQPTLN